MRNIIALFLLALFLWSCNKPNDLSYVIIRDGNNANIQDPENPIFPYYNRNGGELYSTEANDTVLKNLPNYIKIRSELHNLSTKDSIVAYGHCWTEATIDKKKPFVVKTKKNYIITDWKTAPINDQTQSFENILLDLKPDVDYYYRTFIVTGRDTGYSSNICLFHTYPPTNQWFVIGGGFDGSARIGAVAMSVDYNSTVVSDKKTYRKVYIATGSQGGTNYTDEFYEGIMSGTGSKVNMTWSRKTQLGINYRRYDACGFWLAYPSGGLTRSDLFVSMGAKPDGTNNFGDIFEFVTKQSIWRTGASMPQFTSTPRRGSVGFALKGAENRGYVLLGKNAAVMNDMYEYDPIREKWRNFTKTFMGAARQNAVTFVLHLSTGDRAYVGLGDNGDANPSTRKYFNDFYEYKPPQSLSPDDYGQWTKIADFPGKPRSNAVGFSIDVFGYVGTGEDKDSCFADFYMYDPFKQTWARKADFAGGRRSEGVGFSCIFFENNTNNQAIEREFGYVGLGKDQDGAFMSDIWYYRP